MLGPGSGTTDHHEPHFAAGLAIPQAKAPLLKAR